MGGIGSCQLAGSVDLEEEGLRMEMECVVSYFDLRAMFGFAIDLGFCVYTSLSRYTLKWSSISCL